MWRIQDSDIRTSFGKTACLPSLLKTFIYEKNDREKKKKELLIVAVVSVCFMIFNISVNL